MLESIEHLAPEGNNVWILAIEDYAISWRGGQMCGTELSGRNVSHENRSRLWG